MKRRVTFLLTVAVLAGVSAAHAQGVTTGSISGVVNDAQDLPAPGATVVAIHEPSGTRYEAVTADRRSLHDPRA